MQLGVGIAISGLCLWLALRTVPINELGSVLSQANYLWLVLTLLLQFVSILLRAERWRVLLGRRVTLVESFWAYSVGFIFTNIFPFRLGEPARVVVLATQRRLPVVEVAATVGVERLLDIISVLVILLAVLPFMRIPPAVIQAEILFGAGAFIGLAVIFILAKLSDQSEAFLRRRVSTILPTHADVIMARWAELVRGMAVLTQRSIGLPVVGWSIAAWLCSIGIQWSVLRAFQPLAGPVEAAFMVAALALAIAVPAGPGFIGVYQWIGQQSLVTPFPQLYTASTALGIAVTAHLAYYLFTTCLGLIGLWYFGQSFIGLRHRLVRPIAEVEAIPKV